MSKFVEKTLESLNTVFTNSATLISGHDKATRLLPTDVHSFANKLRSFESIKEQEEFIETCLSNIEKRVSQPNITSTEIADMVKICMSCEILGYSAPFICVHALKLAQKGSFQEKHTGYLASSFFLHPRHELVILLINTMQKDLCSSNHAEVLLALNAVCNLIDSETVHNVLHLVEDKLQSENPSIRKLAALTLGHCLRLADSQSSYQMTLHKLEKALSDHDLEVVSAVVQTLYHAITKMDGDFSYLIKTVIELQDQILVRRVPISMNYNDIPAPWLQVDVLKLLSILCKNNDHCQSVMPILQKTLKQAEVNHQMGYAIIYQVIETATYIESTSKMAHMVLSAVSSFLRSKNTNLKFMGVEALILAVQNIKPGIAATQQEIIMECLKQPDETLQLKTLELLSQLANPSNVEAICKKMIEFLACRKDEKRRDLALNILRLVEKHNQKTSWYMPTMRTVLLEAGESVSFHDISGMVNTILKDDVLRDMAKKECLDVCQTKQHLPPCFIKLIAAVLTNPAEFEKFLPYLLEEADEKSSVYLLISLQEALLRTREASEELKHFLKNFTTEFHTTMQLVDQLCHLINSIQDIEPFDPEVEIDPSLTFLDNYVVQSLEQGAACYQTPNFHPSPSFLEMSVSNPLSCDFSTESSEDSSVLNSEGSSLHQSIIYNAIQSPSASVQSFAQERECLPPLPLKKKSVWTKDGRLKDPETSTSEEKEENQECSELFAGIF